MAWQENRLDWRNKQQFESVEGANILVAERKKNKKIKTESAKFC
jgi:hypothetical protein